VVGTNKSAPAGGTAREWHIYLIFDGGSRGNPGQGYGSYVYKGVVSQLDPIQIVYPGRTTNNEAEYMTLNNGLADALAALREQGHDPSQLRIVVKSDSKLVVEQVCGRWKIKKAELRPHIQRAQQLLGQFRSWDLSWHPRSESVRVLGH
jgi:ribonuclease HI